MQKKRSKKYLKEKEGSPATHGCSLHAKHHLILTGALVALQMMGEHERRRIYSVHHRTPVSLVAAQGQDVRPRRARGI